MPFSLLNQFKNSYLANWYRQSFAHRLASLSILVAFFSIFFIAIAAFFITFSVIQEKETELLEKDLKIAANRFNAELNLIQRELLVFSQNPILVNGLADNEQGNAYLKPLIIDQRFAHLSQFRLSLRNYRGEEMIENYQGSSNLLSRDRAKEVLRQNRGFAQSFVVGEEIFFVLGAPIYFPDSNASQGLVSLEFSASELLSRLLMPELDPREYQLSLIAGPSSAPAIASRSQSLLQSLQLDPPLDSLNLSLRLIDQSNRALNSLYVLLPFFFGLVIVGLVVAGVLSALLGRRLAKPILDLAGIARDVKQTGRPHITITSDREDEVGQLTTDFNAMLFELSQLQNNLEAMVRARSERLSIIFELSPDGFLEITTDKKIGYINPAFHQISGIDLVKLNQAHWLVLRNELNQRLTDGEANFSDDLPVERIFKIHTPSLKTISMISRVSESGSTLLYLRDLTREAELQAMKSAFFAKAAHELRTPLTSILGFTELLEKDVNKTPKQAQIYEIIARQSNNLISLVEDLLGLATIESMPKTTVGLSYHSLTALTRLIASELKVPGDERQMVLLLEDHLPEVQLDPKHFRQILSNLWSNAMKYSPPGSPIEMTTCAREKNGTWVGLKIRDFGIGMSPDELEHLGQRFYRANPSGGIAGTGLGVSVVQDLIELHGGVLEYESIQGQGTLVAVWFPVRKS